jgi:hypothetical protein
MITQHAPPEVHVLDPPSHIALERVGIRRVFSMEIFPPQINNPLLSSLPAGKLPLFWKGEGHSL